MSREIKVNANTSVGYLYTTREYYVKNKGTITYREDEILIKRVLDIVAPLNTVTLDVLVGLRENYEKLTSLSYTLHDSGAFITSIQINDYNVNAIMLDCRKQVLYILGTDIVFNLAINESRDTRITMLMDYFRDTLGVDLTRQELTLIYNYLIQMYTPYIYNAISSTEEPVTYSNIFAISNWDNTGYAVYSCTVNPENNYEERAIGNIVEIEASTNTIHVIDYTGNLNQEDEVQVQGTTTSTDTYTYSADGTYIVESVVPADDVTSITTTTALAASYIFPYPKAYLQLATTTITEISREANTITLSSDVSDLITEGDVIEVENTQVEIEGTTVSCNGTYTVSAIQGNVITVQSPLPTNYAYTDQEVQGIVSKNIYIGNLAKAETTGTFTTLNLTKNPPVTVSESQHIFVEDAENNKTYYVINEILSNISFKCVISSYTSTPLTDYTPDYPKILAPMPVTDILIDVTSTTNEKLFPVCSFTVNTFEECQEYLQTLPKLPVPTIETYNNIGKLVGGDIEISEGVLPTCTYLGLYSQVYNIEE